MRILLNLAAISGILLLGSCSDTATESKKTEPAKKAASVPTGPIPALTALYELNKVARKWAPDAEIASLTGSEAGGVKGDEGKYPVWTAVYVSTSMRLAQTYIYSTVEEGRTFKGFNNAGSVRWAGPTRTAMPFSSSDISVDSDAAWKTAAEKAKDWLAKNPDKEVTAIALGHATHFPAPMWYILWGTKSSGYAAYVNASTGKLFGK